MAPHKTQMQLTLAKTCVVGNDTEVTTRDAGRSRQRLRGLWGKRREAGVRRRGGERAKRLRYVVSDGLGKLAEPRPAIRAIAERLLEIVLLLKMTGSS